MNKKGKEVNSPSYTGPERRSNGSGDSSLPYWVRAVAVVGIPGLIAIFLTWVGSQELPKLKTQGELTYQELKTQGEQTRQAVAQTQELMREVRAQLEALHRMEQRVCSNTAGKDENARQRCFDK